MTITTYALGTNPSSCGSFSFQISLTGGPGANTFSQFYAAIKAAITATGTGWSVFDEFLGDGSATGVGGAVTAGSFIPGVTYTITTVGSTNFTAIGASANTTGVVFTATGAGSGTGMAATTSYAYGIVQTLVVQSMCMDGTTPKYMVLRFNIVDGVVNTTAAESWSTASHQGTNEAWTFHDLAPVGFKMDLTDFFIMIHPRYLYVHSYVAGEQSLWSGVVENAREDVKDVGTTAVPFGWVSSPLECAGSQWGYAPLNGTAASHTLICYPRLPDGSTGVNAAKGFACDTGLTSHPHFSSQSDAPLSYYLGSVGGGRFSANAWDGTKRQVLPIKPIFKYASTTPYNFGPLQGLKKVAPSNNNMQQMNIPVDGNGNLSPSGTMLPHWLLNTHHKSINGADPNSWFSASQVKTDITIVANESPRSMCSVGGSVYAVTSANRVVQLTLAGALTVIHTGKTYAMLKYDGERYVYVGTADGVVRIDVTTNTAVFLAVPNGCGSICINGMYLVCSPYTASTSPALHIIPRNAATFTTAVSVDTAALSAYPSTCSLYGDTDGVGNTYFVQVDTQGVANSYSRVQKLSTAGVLTSAQTSLPNSQLYMTAGIKVIDKDHLLVFSGGGSPSPFYDRISLVATATLASIANLNPSSPGNYQGSGATGTWFQAEFVKVGGQVWLHVPYVVGAYPGQNYIVNLAMTSNTAAIMSSPQSDPNFGTNLANGSNSQTQTVASDGARIIIGATSGIRIWTGVNGNAVNGSQTLGQVAIPV